METAPADGHVVSVLIGDNTRMGAELLATALRGCRYPIEVVGTALTSDEVRTELAKNKPDIVVLSAYLKDGRSAGFGLAREIRSSFSKTDVVMMLDVVDRATISQAFCSGAVGVLSRDDPFEVLCKCIHVVSKGQVWANSEQLRMALDTLADTPRASSYPTVSTANAANLLTKSETRLAYLVAEGLTNRDISRQLNLSEHTVRNYLFRIFNKLGTSNRLELALYMINRGELTH
jgi:two-component system nitrate/nitrite response regulator NarL